MFCSKCQLVLRKKVAAQKETHQYKCLLQPYDWFRWGAEKCKVPNLEVKLAPFSFILSNGGEELCVAAFAYTPSLTRLFSFWSRMKRKTNLICSHNRIREFMCREGTLTWHDGTVPDDEIGLKLGGGYFNTRSMRNEYAFVGKG